MIERAANTLIAAIDLVDAEANRLSDKAVHTGLRCAIAIGLTMVAAIFALTGVVGAVWFLAEAIGIPAALVTAGAAGLVITLLGLRYYLDRSS